MYLIEGLSKPDGDYILPSVKRNQISLTLYFSFSIGLMDLSVIMGSRVMTVLTFAREWM